MITMERDKEGTLRCYNCNDSQLDIRVKDINDHLTQYHGWARIDAVECLDNSLTKEDDS